MKKLMSILLLCAFTLSTGLVFGQYHPPGDKQTKESKWEPYSLKLNVVLKAESPVAVFDHGPDSFVSVSLEAAFATKSNKIRENTNFVESYKGERSASIPVIHSFEVDSLKSCAGSILKKLYLKNCSIRQCIC